jgi:hypothetical protein
VTGIVPKRGYVRKRISRLRTLRIVVAVGKPSRWKLRPEPSSGPTTGEEATKATKATEAAQGDDVGSVASAGSVDSGESFDPEQQTSARRWAEREAGDRQRLFPDQRLPD